MQAPQPKRESLVAVLGVGVPCLVLCHFLVHGLGFGLLLLCLPVVGVIVGYAGGERDVYWCLLFVLLSILFIGIRTLCLTNSYAVFKASYGYHSP